MRYQVKITEVYTYIEDIECKDEFALQDILHDHVPLLIDLDRQSLERIRKNGLDFRCEFSW